MRTAVLILIPLLFLAAIVGFTLGVGMKQAFHQQCVIDECPYELHESDTGGLFVYRLTSRIGIVLDSTKDPGANFRVTCVPEGVLGEISNVPAVPAPLYALRYEAVTPGTCIISDDNFAAKIVIKDSDH